MLIYFYFYFLQFGCDIVHYCKCQYAAKGRSILQLHQKSIGAFFKRLLLPDSLRKKNLEF